MKIKSVLIQNFRKLLNCKIEFSDKETIFVGANNSGKTTAMDALLCFLERKDLKTQDFTLHHWKELNKLTAEWLVKLDKEKEEDLSISMSDITPYLPSLDLWIEVENTELHYVSHIIPTLDWTGGILGVQVRFEPKDLDELIKEFRETKKRADATSSGDKNFELWPKNFWDYCERRLKKHFIYKTYLLDPNKPEEQQIISDTSVSTTDDVLKGLIKINTINAQRGFSDANTEDVVKEGSKSLSVQLREYYNKHLDPTLEPTPDDITALKAINHAQKIFDENLKESFQASLEELEELNYPGFNNPNITLATKLTASDGLNHQSAVQYALDEPLGLTLPEKYNGLGYQNLISIVFKLIRFRDEWMRVGENLLDDEDPIEPLQLVLIEEPEAHLHAQVQQVFIKKAYDVLRNHEKLRDSTRFSTQMIISTHSSYIAHQKFESLRYFRRVELDGINAAKVISLKSIFGKDTKTERFVKRYLTTTHNDLLFADAAILVEGTGEKILLPHFITQEHSMLDKAFITILDIGGSHAHRLKPLIEKLELICLIITDIDSIKSDSTTSCRPELDKGLRTSNNTLKKWHPQKKLLDDLLNMPSKDKEVEDSSIRVAFQTGIKVGNKTIYPYTLEDALIIENYSILKKTKNKETGLLKKMIDVTKTDDISEVAQSLYNLVTDKNAKKAEFALDVLFIKNMKDIKAPKYISEGLTWLEQKLSIRK